LKSLAKSEIPQYVREINYVSPLLSSLFASPRDKILTSWYVTGTGNVPVWFGTGTRSVSPLRRSLPNTIPLSGYYSWLARPLRGNLIWPMASMRYDIASRMIITTPFPFLLN
jgi:hypothetical protein